MIIYLFWFLLSVLIFWGTLKSEKKTQLQVVALFLLALGTFVGLGDMLGGYDRYIYGELFDDMADVTQSGGNPWRSYSFSFYGSEFGYGSLCALISFITGNRYIFIFIVTLIIYLLLIQSLSRYVDNAPFAVVMFMGLWMFFSFTYLRQILGATIVWLSIKYIINRDIKRFLLIWFIAFSFHNSAIIFLPVYFIPIRKYTPTQVIITMAIAFLFGLSSIPQALFSAYGEINESRVQAGLYERDTGFRWAYLFESVFFIYVIISNYRHISNGKREIVMLNLSLLFCAVLLFFVRSENGGRLGWYYMIGVFCTMSNLCVKRKRILPQGIIMIILSFVLFFRVLDAWSFNLTPYKTFLTPGHTAAEWIYDRYEYDSNYDKDKFYRK